MGGGGDLFRYICTDFFDSQISGLFHSLDVPHVLLLSPRQKNVNTWGHGQVIYVAPLER